MPLKCAEQIYSRERRLPQNPYFAWPMAPPCAQRGYDAILILGCPNEDNGSPSDCQRARVDLALMFARDGYARHFIVSGAQVHSPGVEAVQLRALLMARGVPEQAIVLEPRAEHTDENLYYSSLLMRERGWTSALVISDQPGQLLYNAFCDANCCVRMGRLTPLDFPQRIKTPLLIKRPVKAARYVLYPQATTLSPTECDYLRRGTHFCTMTFNPFKPRRACADRLKLP